MATETPMVSNTNPNFDKALFWDWRYAEIDWNRCYRSVIERVLERGTQTEWEELIRFYGLPKILEALRQEIKFLPDYTIERIADYFELPKEQMACFIRQRSRKGQWI
jgi:hypothetical protein